MTLGFDNATEQILNGVTEVQLNGGNPLTTPDKASQLVEVVPYLTMSGAFIEEDAQQPLIRVQSDDVAVEPKLFSINGLSTGTGTSLSGQVSPTVQAFAMNVDLSVSRQARINYFANNQVDATNEIGVGLTAVYDTNPVSNPEQFYQKATASTTSGTGDNARTAGNDITITGGREINYLAISIGETVAVASQHVCGFAEFASSDFLTSMPYRVATNPQFAGLTNFDCVVTGSVLTRYDLPIGSGIPISGRTVINTFWTQNDALTTGAAFVHGVGYIK